jgi:lysophospholipase L1-like esterase
MRNGELQGFKAKLIVLLLGTNNINGNPADEIAQGERLIIDEFRKQQPQAKVLLLAVFPRGEQPDNPFRAAVAELNTKLQLLADGKQVVYLDIGDQFLSEDLTLSPDIFPDGLHPNEAGYRIWARSIIDTLRELMK